MWGTIGSPVPPTPCGHQFGAGLVHVFFTTCFLGDTGQVALSLDLQFAQCLFIKRRVT